jgi:hypothetical protein
MSRAQARHLGQVRRLAPEFFPDQGNGMATASVLSRDGRIKP